VSPWAPSVVLEEIVVAVLIKIIRKFPNAEVIPSESESMIAPSEDAMLAFGSNWMQPVITSKI
jgi:hypothetical protein